MAAVPPQSTQGMSFMDAPAPPPTPTLTVAPMAPPTAAPSQPAPSVSTSQTPTPGSDSLPVTGPAGWLLPLAVVLVLLGALLLTMRARRARLR